MEKSESIKELATALCNFQGEVEKIKKEATNPFFKSKYATLANILDVIREPLAKNGLSFVQFPEGTNDLTTMLMHVSGEWISDTYTMMPVKNDPQGVGSCITYQRRYALAAILGLNIDDDDDANKASGLDSKQGAKQPAKPAAKQQAQDSRKVFKDEMLSDVLYEWMHKAEEKAKEKNPDAPFSFHALLDRCYIITVDQIKRACAGLVEYEKRNNLNPA